MSHQRIVAFRHLREKRSKCSLTPIETLEGVFIRRAKQNLRYDGTGHILLMPGAPVLAPEDAFMTKDEEAHFTNTVAAHLLARDESGRALRPILLLDSVWRLFPIMRGKIVGEPVERSLPDNIVTAYPRASKMTEDPEDGLATIEALYAALKILGCDRRELLDGYLWREAFLRQFDEL
jgi:pre-rRNA-processing protein TSR3